ncbi:hypothetical protein XENTR_v10004714 [Xenopus tropicalis]|nr:hypothetical protein XENTR_v10004714 [Xenopus tropicalis]KAE8621185.1 hypothetical protein XENTR_v10004714 [Xenopus tropicalis]KAE8621186.1 hypothetical protein XENTR_v10004714 [Xenopus tropicalis]
MMRAGKVKKKPRRGSETEESLCCCEYINQKGERSHLAACLCDCEDVDEACDRWISRKSSQPEVWARALETASDRFRVPWIRGARRIDVKQDPGYLLKHAKDSGMKSEGGCELANGIQTVRDCDGFPQPQTDGDSLVAEKNWCKMCQLVRPPRSGHCMICGFCVRRLDHHCVWINNCIGSHNHRFFILLLLFFLFTSVYGITVTLNLLCRGRNAFVALLYCPGVYTEYSTAFNYTCVWYCAIVTAGMAYILLIQLINISYNVTEREARIALRNKTARRMFCGLVVDTGAYNQGFFQNWQNFLQMDCSASADELGAIV